MANAPTQYTLIPGPSTQDPAQGALVVADGNGGLASIVTPWLLNASGIYIPWPVSAGGHPQVDVTGSLPAGTAQLGSVGIQMATSGNPVANWVQANVNNNAQAGNGVGMIAPYLRDFSNAFYAQALVPGSTGCAATPQSGQNTVYITTATTTAVKASGGVIGTIACASGATTGVITVYDNTSASGDVVWTGTLAAGQVLPLGMPCGTGITIVTAAADAIACSFA